MQQQVRCQALFLVMLVMMSISGLVASDIFLPALPEISEYFGITASQGQSILGIFLAGLAGMQLLYGPVSDSIGRRRLLLGGIAVFGLASVGIIFAKSFDQVLALRILQSVGACAGITLGRAIVGDLYEQREAGRIFLSIFPVVGMSPAVAPMVGGFLYGMFGWQSCFLFTAIFAAALWVLVWRYQPETRAADRRTRLSVQQIFRNYGELLRSMAFLRYAAIPCFAYAAYFSYIAESPYLLARQGLPKSAIGFSYITLSLTYVTGNFIARRAMKTRSLDSTLRIGYRIFLTGGAAMVAALSLRPDSLVLGIGAISILTLGNGFLLPLGTAGAITAVPRLSGSASGLMGCLQLFSAAAAAQLVGIVSRHDPVNFSLIIGLIALTGFLLNAPAMLPQTSSD
jgi:MFS transporter, DHA1 family, multidrug resistance protein